MYNVIKRNKSYLLAIFGFVSLENKKAIQIIVYIKCTIIMNKKK